MKSFIGKQYIPNDNSYSLDITPHLDRITSRDNIYLAGTNELKPKIGIIVSNPFKSKVVGRQNENEMDFIIVKTEDEKLCMVLWNEECFKSGIEVRI